MINDSKDDNYNDIINLPHHVSKTHPRMSLHDRAAQFSPFAALTGHEEEINESARLTEKKLELDEDEMMEKDLLMNKLEELKSKKSELIMNMEKSTAKNGVDAIIDIIMKSIC